jgi:hypothetical protein
LEFAELADVEKLEFPLKPDKVEVDEASFSYYKRFSALLMRLCISAFKLFPIFSKITSTKIRYEILIPPLKILLSSDMNYLFLFSSFIRLAVEFGSF